MLAGIEVYNKPDFKYREETFSLLMLNAWELLLKARLLHTNGNDPRCLYVYESRMTASGERSKKQYIRRNHAGNPMTRSIGSVIAKIAQNSGSRLPAQVQ